MTIILKNNRVYKTRLNVIFDTLGGTPVLEFLVLNDTANHGDLYATTRVLVSDVKRIEP